MKLRLASNVSRAVKTIHMRSASNVSRKVSMLHVRTAGNVSRIGFDSASASGLTVTPDYLSVFGAANSHAPIAIQTNVVTVTITGGKAPYDIAWTADFGGWTIPSDAALSTYFLSDNVGPGDSADNSFTCTVTDDNGDTATCGVAASVSNFGV